jgi:hypothetical protein
MSTPELIIPWIPALRTGDFGSAARATINHWYPEDCSHRPPTEFCILYSPEGFHLRFNVEDRDVLCRYTNYSDPVYKDSCVECFLHPESAPGYFNFEFNALGACLASYVENPTRTPDGFEKYTRLSPEFGKKISVSSDWNGKVGKIDAGSVTWTLSATIPWSVFNAYCDAVTPPEPGAVWRGNFYKCGDETPHPHWGAWNDVGEPLDFHKPSRFGAFILGER